MALFQYQNLKKEKKKRKEKWNDFVLVRAQVKFEKYFRSTICLSPLFLSRLHLRLSLSLYLSSTSVAHHHSPPISSATRCHHSPSFPLSSFLFVMAIIQKFLEYVLMLNNKYVNLYNAQYLGYFYLAPCYASRNIGNLFENFVWILEKYSKHVFFFWVV